MQRIISAIDRRISRSRLLNQMVETLVARVVPQRTASATCGVCAREVRCSNGAFRIVRYSNRECTNVCFVSQCL